MKYYARHLTKIHGVRIQQQTQDKMAIVVIISVKDETAGPNEDQPLEMFSRLREI